MNYSLGILIIAAFIGLCRAEKIVTDVKMDSLINEDDAVVLVDDIICKITGYNDAEIQVYQKVLIKNKKGEGFCSQSLSESDFVTVDDIDARLLDINGDVIKKLQDDDIQESSSFPGFVLFSENTAKHFRLIHNRYPFIFELSYKRNIKSLFFWPSWYPQSSVPAKSSTYKLILDTAVPFKTYAIGMDIEPLKIKEGGDSVYIWKAENIAPKVKEDFLPPEDKVQMAVLFAPVNFSLNRSQGSFRNWDYVANWFNSLYSGKTILLPETKLKIQDLVRGISSETEKIRILYNYLQNNTRYVAISLGIGGWEPHDAESVFMNQYGDCKDLSTLMVAMLAETGIKAYPALALTRAQGLTNPDFPSNQFNHCIAFVPLPDDTLWLECTGKYLDIDEMPYTIEGINALVVKENGGELIKTPQSKSSDNKWESFSEVGITKNGTTVVQSRIVTSGQQKRRFKNLMEFADSEDQLDALQKYLSTHVPNLTIDQFMFSEVGPDSKKIKINFSGVYKKAFSKSGTRLFINPSLFNRETSRDVPDEEIEKRKFDIHFNYAFSDCDTVRIEMPFGYGLEAAPDPVEIKTSFARFKMNYEVKDHVLFYTRSIEFKKNHIERQLYPEFVDFEENVVKIDKAKFVFKKGLALKDK